MDHNVIEMEASETVVNVVAKMMKKGVWSCVVTRGNLPVGYVTEHTILRNCYAKGLSPEKTTLDSVMISPITTIEPGARIGDAMALMIEKNIQRVFVVDKGKIVGRITHTDLLRGMFNAMVALSSVSTQS